MNEYHRILNPITGRNVNLFGKKGQSVLKKYINQVGGARKETRSIKCKPLIGDKLGEGSFKKAYTIDCDKDKSQKCFGDKLFNCNQQYDCRKSAIVITKQKKDDFYSEIDTQKKLVETPKIHKYGRCKDGNDFDDSEWDNFYVEEIMTIIIKLKKNLLWI